MIHNIEFKWIGGACWSLDFDEVGFKLVCDPVLCPKGTIYRNFFSFQRITEPNFSAEEMSATNLWLITHNHYDHLDEYGLKFIGNNSHVVTHQNAQKRIMATGATNIKVLEWLETTSIDFNNLNIKITAVPAFHTKTSIGQLIAGGVNGYYLEIKYFDRECSVYVTSDTLIKRSLINEMKKRNIDVMIPNFGAAQKNKWYGPVTMDHKMLQTFIKELNPKLVIPVHYNTFSHYKEGEKELKDLKEDRIKIIPEGMTLSI